LNPGSPDDTVAAKEIAMDRSHQGLRKRFEKLDAASICDASPLVRAFQPGLIPLHPELRMAGKARPIGCSNDYLSVIKGLSEAHEGEVLVIDGRSQTYAIFGELLAAEAKRRGLAGAIVDGSVRDIAGMRALDFPVFYRAANPRAGRAEVVEPPTEILSVCGVTVMAGDWIFGDADGIVVIPADHAEMIVKVAEEIEQVEAKVFASVQKGASLTEIMKFEEFCRDHDRDIRKKLDYHLSER
jgi:4-hydroxy-4-methyl-2-oxoglutarate aldolase